MIVKYAESVKQWGEGYTLAQQGTRRLDEVLGPSAAMATVEWDRGEDEKGRTLLTLRLSDFSGEVTARFAPDELRSSAQTSFRLNLLWGHLLQIRNQKQLEKLTGTGG
jgi:hypothetical protein